MNILQQLRTQSVLCGHKVGESAAQFRKRDPKGARKLAEWIAQNQPAIVAAVSGALKRA